MKRHDDERTEEKPFVSRQQRPSWLKVGKPRSLVNWKSGFNLGTQSPSIILQVLNTKEIFLRAFLSKNDKIVFATKVSCLPFLSSRYTQLAAAAREAAADPRNVHTRRTRCTVCVAAWRQRMEDRAIHLYGSPTYLHKANAKLSTIMLNNIKRSID